VDDTTRNGTLSAILRGRPRALWRGRALKRL
jgi:hypothetical protein